MSFSRVLLAVATKKLKEIGHAAEFSVDVSRAKTGSKRTLRFYPAGYERDSLQLQVALEMLCGGPKARALVVHVNDLREAGQAAILAPDRIKDAVLTGLAATGTSVDMGELPHMGMVDNHEGRENCTCITVSLDKTDDGNIVKIDRDLLLNTLEIIFQKIVNCPPDLDPASGQAGAIPQGVIIARPISAEEEEMYRDLPIGLARPLF